MFSIILDRISMKRGSPCWMEADTTPRPPRCGTMRPMLDCPCPCCCIRKEKGGRVSRGQRSVARSTRPTQLQINKQTT